MCLATPSTVTSDSSFSGTGHVRALVDHDTRRSSRKTRDVCDRNFLETVLKKLKLESLTRHETSSTVCLRLLSDGFGTCYSTVTLTFDLLTSNCEAFISVP